jgi:SNF2 family DNA or RNA helicase
MPLRQADRRHRPTAKRRSGASSEGEIPIFLISLKAGGVGLNLTACRHRDPLRSVVEPGGRKSQATDRAHRLGQDKPVFVYQIDRRRHRIEEKILALQERKAELAAGILSEDRGIDVKFGNDDLAALFEPLPA